MKIAIFGDHAAGHFMTQKFLEEPQVKHVHLLLGNPSLAPTTRYSTIDPNKLIDANYSYNSLFLNYLDQTELDLAIIISTLYQCNQAVQNKIIDLATPTASCSFKHGELEWCKATGKALLLKAGVKTPRSKLFAKQDLFEKFFEIPRPFVLKFIRDWRAGLQTLIITDENCQEEFENLKEFGQSRMLFRFGEFSNQKFMVEEYIDGRREYSYHFISNEKGWKYLGSARDYKRFNDGDQGFNTAGMGSYSPVDINPQVHKYAAQIYDYLKEQGTPYKGIMYLGIMEDSKGEPYVLEINTRPGDPEFQSIVLSYGEDFSLSKMFYQCAHGLEIDNQFDQRNHAVSLRIVHSRYREFINLVVKKELHKEGVVPNPHLYPEPPDLYISYGTDRRILNSVISTSADSRTAAADKIYKFVNGVSMHDFTYRKDIGYLI